MILKNDTVHLKKKSHLERFLSVKGSKLTFIMNNYRFVISFYSKLMSKIIFQVNDLDN